MNSHLIPSEDGGGNLGADRIRFSVITVCQDNADRIQRCVQSVVTQSHPNVEHIVVYRQGHEPTLEVLLRHQSSLTIVFAASRDNTPHALNRGMTESNGHVIGFLDANAQFASPDVLSQVAIAFEDPRVHAVYGDTDWTAPRASRWPWRQTKTPTSHHNRLSRSQPKLDGLFVQRHSLSQTSGFDLTLPETYGEDMVHQLIHLPSFEPQYIGMSIIRKERPPLTLMAVLKTARMLSESCRMFSQKRTLARPLSDARGLRPPSDSVN